MEWKRVRCFGESKRGIEVQEKTVITWDYEEEGEVRFIPLWKWLLNNPY